MMVDDLMGSNPLLLVHWHALACLHSLRFLVRHRMKIVILSVLFLKINISV